MLEMIASKAAVAMDDLRDKRVLVTGATAGIGKETARALARLGAHVVIVGRNPSKTQSVLEEIRGALPGARIDALVADLSSMAQVRRLGDEYRAKYGALHVLVNNAGGLQLKREVTVDGLELTFALNHLAYFVLTLHLLPALKEGGRARIVNVASEAHRRQTLDFGDLQLQKSYGAFRAYGRSKLMNILFTRELARRLAGQTITANALHPGVVASSLYDKPGWWGIFGRVGAPFMRSSEKGAQTGVFLAASDEVDGISGGYWSNKRRIEPSVQARDDATAARLWEVSCQLGGVATAAA